MKTKHYFGTDGIRGTVGVAPITPDFVMRVGYAVGRLLVSLPNNLVQGGHPSVLIGKDTRISGYMLESALEAGLIAAGADVLLTGPLPTPAVAYLTRALRAQAGIVISASHNLYNDNGLKFFSSTGHKLDDHLEQAIEEMSQKQMQVVSADKLGKAKRLDDATGRYVEFCKSTFPSHLDLRGLKIMVDCAHGATYHVAPPVLHELGAEVIAIHNTPDGFNINRDSGTIAPQALREAMLQSQADVGIAFDGDGDRLLMVDAEGNILTGDGLLYIIARARQQEGRLHGGVVGTVMSNLALEQAFQTLHIPFARAAVGDRYVYQELTSRNWQLGGENSGHLLLLDKHSSGDGIIAALEVLCVMRSTGQDLKTLAATLKPYPQTLLSVVSKVKDPMKHNLAVKEAVQQAQQQLGKRGRVLVRSSGTEAKIRVMVEGEDVHLVEELAQRIAICVS